MHSLVHDYLSDARVLFHLLVRPVRGATHAERMEDFYKGQASDYTRFRRRLLLGREELCRHLPPPSNGVWVDLGAGSGDNLGYSEAIVAAARRVYLVDLSTSLLRIASERVSTRGWKHVTTAAADATDFTAPEGQVDLVTFSYSLTMIPDWFAAIDHAVAQLRLGGTLGVVDFYVARRHAAPGQPRHNWATRNLWPLWFSQDNVMLSQDHVPYLKRKLECVHFSAHWTRVPYMLGMCVPYYVFVGRKV